MRNTPPSQQRPSRHILPQGGRSQALLHATPTAQALGRRDTQPSPHLELLSMNSLSFVPSGSSDSLLIWVFGAGLRRRARTQLHHRVPNRWNPQEYVLRTLRTLSNSLQRMSVLGRWRRSGPLTPDCRRRTMGKTCVTVFQSRRIILFSRKGLWWAALRPDIPGARGRLDV